MSVNSYSTWQQVRDSMADNSNYDEVGSLPKANSFVTACRVWMVKFANKRSQNSESELEMMPELVQKQLDTAIEWIRAQPSGGSTNGNYAGYSKVTLAHGRD